VAAEAVTAEAVAAAEDEAETAAAETTCSFARQKVTVRKERSIGRFFRNKEIVPGVLEICQENMEKNHSKK